MLLILQVDERSHVTFRSSLVMKVTSNSAPGFKPGDYSFSPTYIRYLVLLSYEYTRLIA